MRIITGEGQLTTFSKNVAAKYNYVQVINANSSVILETLLILPFDLPMPWGVRINS